MMELPEKMFQRIKTLRAEQKLSQKAFADEIGITQGALSQLESGKSSLSVDTTARISKAFAIDCNWLIFGDGDKFLNPSKHIDKNAEASNESSSIDPANKNNSLVPLVKEEAHAGYIAQCHHDDYIKTLDVYKIPGFDSGRYRMFEIAGDSMVPTMLPREIVVTELKADWKDIENGTLVVVVSDDGIVTKRFYYHESQSDQWILKSDNPDYDTYSLNRKQVRQIWEIKAKITHVFAAEIHSSDDRLKAIEDDIRELKASLIK